VKKFKETGGEFTVVMADDVLAGDDGLNTDDGKKYRHKDDEDCGGLPRKLFLARGFPVMYRGGHATKDGDNGLVNGALGTLVDYDISGGDKWIAVKFHDKRVGAKEFQFAGTRVRSDGAVVLPVDFVQYKGKHGKTLYRYQFPVVNAFALTVHKAQGRSEDACHLALGKSARQPGLAYVGLSRCRTSAGVYLSRLSEDAFVSQPRVDVEMRRLHMLTPHKVKTWTNFMQKAWAAIAVAQAKMEEERQTKQGAVDVDEQD